MFPNPVTGTVTAVIPGTVAIAPVNPADTGGAVQTGVLPAGVTAAQSAVRLNTCVAVIGPTTADMAVLPSVAGRVYVVRNVLIASNLAGLVAIALRRFNAGGVFVSYLVLTYADLSKSPVLFTFGAMALSPGERVDLQSTSTTAANMTVTLNCDIIDP